MYEEISFDEIDLLDKIIRKQFKKQEKLLDEMREEGKKLVFTKDFVEINTKCLQEHYEQLDITEKTLYEQELEMMKTESNLVEIGKNLTGDYPQYTDLVNNHMKMKKDLNELKKRLKKLRKTIDKNNVNLLLAITEAEIIS